MGSTAELQNAQSKSGQNWVTPALIVALLALRFLITAWRMFFAEAPWVDSTYQIGTYLLLAILLVWEHECLDKFHISSLAVWIIILFKPLETLYFTLVYKEINSPMALPKLPSLLIWLIAVGLAMYFRPKLIKSGGVSGNEWRWVMAGLGAGLGMAILVSYPLALQRGLINPQIKGLLWTGLYGILVQIGYAAVSEEPVFRGFLWGYLKRCGWQEDWIWVFQALMFMLAHLYYLGTENFSFFIIIPVGGLFFGWLAWRSRSIATSMVAHGVANSLASTLSVIIAALRG